MAKDIELKIDIKSDPTSINGMEKALSDLKDEIKDVDRSTKEGIKQFDKLSNEIRSAESEVKNLNKSFEGLDTEALTGEFGKLAGGITGAMTGIAVLGDDANKSMEAMMETVAKGMAIAQGFKGATEAMTSAQRVYNAVLKANPIGLIITAITLFIGLIVTLITQGDKIIKMLDGWAEKFTFLQGPIDIVKAGIQGLMDLWEKAQRFFLGDDAVDKMLAEKADKIRLEESKKTNDFEVKRLEAIQASEKDIYDAKKKALEERLELMKLNNEEESDDYKQLQIDMMGLETTHTKHLEDAETKRLEIIKLSNEKKLKAEEDFQEELKTLDEDLKQYYIDKQKAQNEKLLEIKKNYDESIAEDFEMEEEEDIEDDPIIARQMEINEFLRNQTLDNQLLTNEGLDALYKSGLISYEDYMDAKQSIEDKSFKHKMDVADAIAGLSNELSGLFKEDTIAHKAFAIATIAIDTALGMVKALAQYPPPNPIGIISAAAIGVAGTAASLKVSGIQFARGGVLDGPSHAQGGILTPFGELEGGEGVINTSSMSNPSLRNLASIANTGGGGEDFSTGDGSVKLSSDSISMIVNGINDKKVYVSETDITETQNKVSVIESEATL